MPEIGAPKGVTKHTDLTDKEVVGVIDHAAGSVTPAKLKAVDSPADTEIPSYDALSGLFKWVAAPGITVHDKTYHVSPTLPDDDAHKTASPIDHPDASVTNAKIIAAAGIPYSKLNLALAILNADIAPAAAIAYAKLALTGALLPADLSAIDSPADGEAATYDSATGKFEWVPVAVYDPWARMFFYSMMGENWPTLISGSGSLSNIVLIATFATGATANSYAMIDALINLPQNKAQEFEWYVGTDVGVPNWTTRGYGPCLILNGVYILESFVWYNNAPRYGFYFVNDATYANRVLAITSTTTGRTVTNLAAFPTKSTCYRAVYIPGQKVEFYIDGALVATHTTNLPNNIMLDVLLFGVSSYLGTAGNKEIYLKTVRGYADY